MRRFGRINSDADFVDSLRDICDELLVSDNPQYTACIQKARSGDGSESLVLSAIRHNNKCGVSMSLALAGFFHSMNLRSLIDRTAILESRFDIFVPFLEGRPR